MKPRLGKKGRKALAAKKAAPKKKAVKRAAKPQAAPEPQAQAFFRTALKLINQNPPALARRRNTHSSFRKSLPQDRGFP